MVIRMVVYLCGVKHRVFSRMLDPRSASRADHSWGVTLKHVQMADGH